MSASSVVRAESQPGFHPVLSRWNPLDQAELANPYPTYALARREMPVFYSKFFRAWVATRYDDIKNLLRDTRLYSNRGAIGSSELPDDVKADLPYGMAWDYPSLENNDPPGHTRIRKLSNQAFTPSVVASQEGEIRSISEELIDGFAAQGRGDLVPLYANHLPGLVMARILGVPPADTDAVVRWVDQTVVLQNPNLSVSERAKLVRDQARFYAYCAAFIDDRTRNPRDDVMSRLIQATAEGERTLSPPEVISTFSHFLIGGNETTRRLIGNMALCLLRSPDQLAEVRRDLALVPAAVDETLRFMSPVKSLFRTTTQSADLGAVQIPPEATVVVLFASANHDETKFAHAEEFDIHRPQSEVSRHLAFGMYTHFCIGAPLARLEARVALEHLLTKLPNFRRANDDELEWMPLVNHQGLEHLDLVWDKPNGSRN